MVEDNHAHQTQIYFFIYFLNTIVFRLGPGCKFGDLTRRGTVSYLGEIEKFENCNSANSLTKIVNILTHQSVDHVLVGSNYELEVENHVGPSLEGTHKRVTVLYFKWKPPK